MGTKVQCKSYLPGYYPMRDLNLNANNGSWSLSYEEKILKSGQYYNYFSSTPMDGSEYDKEALKKTMLKHEVTFRNQVHELHRLYRIQRDLMNELHNKELNKYSALFETSQPDPFSSQIPFGDTQNIWKMPTLPGAKFSCSWPSLLGADNKQSPLNFAKDIQMHTGLSPTKNRVNAKDNELLDSKLKKVTRTFDLQLPATDYIFSEDGEAIQEEKGRELPLAAMHSPSGQCGVEHESDVNLSLGSGGDPSYKVDDWRPNSHLHGGHIHCVADLNKPIQGMCSEEAEASASVSFLGFMCHRAETQGKQVPSVQNLGIFGRSNDSLQDNQKSEDCSSFSNFLHGENGTKHEQLSYCLEAGKCRSKSNSFSPVLCHEQSPTSTKSIQTELKKAHELPALPLADKSKREASFIENATCSIQIPRSPRLNISNHSAPVTPQIPTRFSDVSSTDDVNAASPLVSSWKQPANRIIRVPVAAQALPCINGSAALNVQTKSSNPSIQSPRHNWDLNSNLSLHPSFGSEVCYQNGFNNGSSSESNVPHVVPLIGFEKLNPDVGDCSAYNPVEGGVPGKILTGLHFQDVKSANDINLNVCLPNGFREEVDHRSDHVLIGGERKHRDSRMSWLRTRPVCNESRSLGDGAAQMDLGFIEACSGLLSSQDAKIQLLECENKTEKGPVFLKDFSSTLHTEDGETCKTDQAESPSNKNIGFPALSKSSNFEGQHAFSSSSMPCRIQSEINDAEKSVRVGLLHADIACDLPLHDSEKQIHAENPVTHKGIDSNRTMGSTDREINLNSRVDMLDISFTSTNDSEFSTSVSGAPLVDIAVAIDLETPILPDTFEFTPPTPPRGPVAANKQVTSTQPKQCEMEGPKNLLARTAAEAIVAMSSEIRNQSDDAGCHTSPDDLMDPLRWFSEVVFSNTSDLDGKAGSSRGMSDADKEASDDEGIDFFEAMTLKLVETKVEDEYLCNKLQQEHDNQDDDSGIPPLLSRPRRRQTRRRRQRMDFQKDILPGLVSLSRHEVTEDLQLLEGLMRALGCSWQSGLSRKNTVRNGWHCRGRGRRQPRGLAAAARMGKLVGQPPWQPSHGEVERKGISLQGWGKTTRRCHRRQRLPMADAI
ncbi:uncharacterized protein LOC131219201 [Magnolia sinica]|uniref:uncharacterized protein LOC131219201 n=1 Tax=Magnolia sinica TaxID=86752 RepID=UPI00265831D6|nr:uncharacterized protein LOC131219201 [Magnolia sinica]